MGHQRWTPAEDVLLKKLVGENKKTPDIAKVMTHRTEYAIHNRRAVLNLAYMTPKLSRRNPQHLAEVIKFKMAGWTHAEIAKVFDVTVGEVSDVLCYNGFRKFLWVRRKLKNKRKCWTEIEEARLRKYLEKDYPLHLILSKFSHRSPRAIKSKIRRITRFWLSPEELAERERLAKKYRNQMRVY